MDCSRGRGLEEGRGRKERGLTGTDCSDFGMGVGVEEGVRGINGNGEQHSNTYIHTYIKILKHLKFWSKIFLPENPLYLVSFPALSYIKKLHSGSFLLRGVQARC